MKYIYQKQSGELYISDKYISYEDRENETYGLCDWLIGQAKNREEANKILRSKVKKKNTKKGILDKEYVAKFINENFGE